MKTKFAPYLTLACLQYNNQKHTHNFPKTLWDRKSHSNSIMQAKLLSNFVLTLVLTLGELRQFIT